MAQTVGRSSFTVEVHVIYQTDVRGVCVRQNGGGTVFFSCSAIFRRQYYATICHTSI
jgi:hypothetical protein